MARKTKSKSAPTVVGRHGRFPFQTGMVTASLLRRGLSMADAVLVARAVRDAVENKSEISSEKLTTRILTQVERHLGPEVAARIETARTREDAVPMVETARGRVPFSHGDMLRLLETAGLRLNEAIAFVGDVDRWMRSDPGALLTDARVHEEVARMLQSSHGESEARRYRFLTWVRRSRTPLVILIGGATGTGKSTLAMELAYRLGVVWVTNTDLIRETMRSVLSAEIVPGLHDHSFRGMFVGGEVLSDPRERVLAGFHQQAAQVGVGVRAVIRRALVENTHIIIEGTHLTPPFRQYLPAEAAGDFAGFLLAVPDEVRHRKRFPERAAKEPRRSANTYLDAFQSVRWIHEELLRMAEDEEAVVLTNDKLGKTLTGAVDFLSRELTRAEPAAEPPPTSIPPGRGPAVPTLFLVLDGLADEPSAALGGKTPLEAANKPTFRRLAATGGQGQVVTGATDGQPASTHEGILALLGAPGDSTSAGRGLFEALGRGASIPPGAVLLRGNLATVDEGGLVVDRRAGRIRTRVSELLAKLTDVSLPGGVTGRILPGHEHRVVVILSGADLSAAVSDTDPGEQSRQPFALAARPLETTVAATRTAHALRALHDLARAELEHHPVNEERSAAGLLPANAILTRGAAGAPRHPFGIARNGAMVSGCNTALGVARYLGLTTFTSPRMTGNLDTDLDAKLGVAGDLLTEHDLVVVHVKGTDIAAHDRNPSAKRDFITAIDGALARFLDARPEHDGSLRIVVSADHGTSSTTGHHLPAPVPLLVTTWNATAREEQDFDEESAARGALGVLQPGELATLLGIDAGSSRSLAVR